MSAMTPATIQMTQHSAKKPPQKYAIHVHDYSPLVTRSATAMPTVTMPMVESELPTVMLTRVCLSPT